MFMIGHVYKEKHGTDTFEVEDAFRSRNGKVYYFGWWISTGFPENNPSGTVMEDSDFEEFVRITG